MKICPECMGGSIGSPQACAECGADVSEAPDRKGSQLNEMVLERKYRLTEFIGEGAMGWVYRGTHLSLGSSVAVKLMKPSGDDDVNDRRFAQEARAASRLNSPHIISIMDFGRSPGGLLFIVSEYLRGATLDTFVAEDGAIPVGRTLHIADQVLTGLEEAHESGLIHRDLKPENVMLDRLRSGEDFVKILDFGIAKLTGNKSTTRLTQQGQVIGTPTYMAPEQIRGKEVTARTDLYSLGAMIFEMLAGRPPFDSESVMEVLGMHLSAEMPTIEEVAPGRNIPPELEAVLRRTMRKDPAERFESASALRETLALISAGLAREQATCAVCGNETQGTAKFCEHCGARLGDEPPVTLPLTEAPPVGPKNRATADTVYQSGAPIVDGRATGQTQAASSALDLPSLEPINTIPPNTLNRRLRVEQTREFQLVGREQELQAIESFFDGEAGCLEILGPLGSGRTRLLQESEDIASNHGYDVMHMGPDPTLARRPWLPVQQVVGQLLDLDEGPSLPALEAAIRRSGLAPEDLRGLSEIFGLQDPQEYMEHAVRLRETRAAALRALSSVRDAAARRVLLVDDADELDGASRAWLSDVVAADSPSLKIVLTGESSVVGDHSDVRRVEPKPLSLQEITTLLESVVDERTASWSGRLNAVAENSGGNVLHVTQALRLLTEGGTEVDAPLADIIVTRVQRLPTEALRLLQTVSVVGQSAPLQTISALLDQDIGRYEGAIRLLVKRGLLTRAPPDGMALGHPRIGDAVREAMPAHVRRQVHLEVLEDLEARGAPPVALARHAAEARLGERALSILTEAGHRAEMMLDDAGAAIHYRRALHVARWELLREEGDDVCLDLTLRVGNSLRYCGDQQGAVMVLQEGVQATQNNPGWHARMLHALSLVQLSQGKSTAALETMQSAVQQAFFSGQPALLNQIYMDLGKVLDVTGEGLRAAEELAEGVLMVTAGDGVLSAETPDTFWRLLAQLSELHFRHDNVSGALETAKAALAQAERHDSCIGQARCHFLLGRCHDRLGETDRAEPHHERALTAFRQLGDRRSAAEVLLSDASRKPEERQELMKQARALSEQINWQKGIEASRGQA